MERSIGEKLHDAVQPERNKLREEFANIFSEKLQGPPPERAVEADINTGVDAPVNKRAYRMSPKEKRECQQQVTELREADIIRSSISPWTSPVLFVEKENGDLRMCMDFCAVNLISKRVRYPLPRIDEIFDDMAAGKIFSRLDLKGGYHQLRVWKNGSALHRCFNW